MRAAAFALLGLAVTVGIAHGADDVQPRWSPDGKTIAFIRFVAGREDGLYLVDRSGRGLRRLRPIPSTFVWSPLGDLIAYATPAGIELLRRDGSSTTVLSTGPAGHVAWSPDGRTIAFVGGFGPPDTFEVWAIEANGEGLRRLAAATSSSLAPELRRLAWSPDSTRVAFAAAGEIGVVRRDGRDERRFAIPLQNPALAVEAPAWSPDGTRIAVAGAAIIDVATGVVTPSLFALREVVWSPGGGRLAAVREGPRLPYPFVNATSDLYLTDANGRRGRLVARTTWIHALDPQWAPDGRHLAFVGESVCPGRGIYTVDVRTRRVRRVTNRCTIEGAAGDDRMRGTDHADVILGGGGNDHIRSRGGMDVVYGGPGADVLDARGERDLRDSDRLIGGPGDDLILARDGALDVVHCGPGRDRASADRDDLVGTGCERVGRS